MISEKEIISKRDDISVDADVLILAAGFGKRLSPITDSLPKALVRVGQKTLIERHLERLSREGFKRVIINLHYLGEKIKDFVRSGSRWGISVEYSEENPILDTGGAIKQIESRIKGEQLITINCDCLLGEDFSLRSILSAHKNSKLNSLATLALRSDVDAKLYGSLAIDSDGRICEFLGKKYVEHKIVQELMFLGVSVIEPKLFGYMPAAGAIFSITRDIYPKVLSTGGVLSSYLYSGYWSDIGTHERLVDAQKNFPL